MQPIDTTVDFIARPDDQMVIGIDVAAGPDTAVTGYFRDGELVNFVVLDNDRSARAF